MLKQYKSYVIETWKNHTGKYSHLVYFWWNWPENLEFTSKMAIDMAKKEQVFPEAEFYVFSMEVLK